MIQIKVLSPLFVSFKDGALVPVNYTTNLEILPTIGQADINTIVSLTNTAEKILVINFVIPFILMIFLSFSMDRVWSLYLML